MKNRRPNARRWAALAIALLVLLFPLLSLADVGNFSGGSDYGGGGSDWGGSSDWGSSDSSSGWGGSGWIIGLGDSEGGSAAVGVIIFVAIIVFAVMLGKKKQGAGPVAPGAQPTVGLQPAEDFMREDPQFSQAKFCEDLSNLYVQMQQAWQDKKWEPMRAQMTDELYNQLYRQVQEMVRADVTNYVERIAVLSVQISGWRRDEVNDVLVARLRTRIVDYTVQDATGKVVSGSRTAEKFMEYEWTMIRAKGVQSGKPVDTAKHCPSCGAPIDIAYSAKCEYCGTVVVNSMYDWVLSSIRGLSQRTVG